MKNKLLPLLLSLTLFLTCIQSFEFAALAADPASTPSDLPIEAGGAYNTYTPLKELYEDYFLVGTCKTDDDPVAIYHFNAYTPENDMKPQSIQPTKSNFIWPDYTSILNNGMELMGHTLAWFSQTPGWMWDAPDYDPGVAEENLKAHITAVMERYGSEMHSIDVVNEAVGSAPNPADWETAVANQQGGWSRALGPEFVEKAFLAAAEVVDENGWDCKLYYNEISMNSPAKARSVYEMVKALNEKYAGTRPNGKNLIEGVGFQGHYNQATKIEDVEAAVALIATLPGVSISFTEVDVEFLNAGSLTSEQAIKQGQKYAQLFELFKKYAAGSANNSGNPQVIERVTLWGTNDDTSWKANAKPLLFDNDNAKEAFVAACYPAEYLEAYPLTGGSDPDERYNPGVHYWSLDNGDNFTGANIILGNDANTWPYSTAGGDGLVAFTPEPGAKYRLTVNCTTLGTNMIRTRWIKDNSKESYTTQDGAEVGNHNVGDPGQVATKIPNYFSGGMIGGGTYSLVTEFTVTGDEQREGLIGNIAIRGGSGGNAFTINSITIVKVGDEGNLLVNWPEGVAAPSPTLAVSPGSLDFGAVTAGGVSAAKTVTVTGGNLMADIAWNTPAGYTITKNTGWDNRTGGTLSVTFTPTAVQTYNSTLTISSTGASSASVSLTGTGQSSGNNNNVGGGDGGTTAMSPTIPAADGATSVGYTQSGGTVTLDMPANKVTEIIDKAKDGAATLDLSGVSGATDAAIPKTALSQIAGTGLDVEIRLPQGTVTLDAGAAASAADQAAGDSITVSLRELEHTALTPEQQSALNSGHLVLDITMKSGTSVISSFGGTITVTVPYSGELPAAVWYLNSAGELEKLNCTYDAKTGTVTFTTDHLSLYVVGKDTEFVNPFTDVKNGDWFYDDVMFVYSKGLMTGTGEGLFSPQTSVTRGMIVTILYRQESSPTVSGASNQFNDVTEGKWYTDAVKWAAENGIVLGYDNGNFGPDDNITRQDFAVILWRYAEYAGIDVSAGENANILSFGDAFDVAEYAMPAMQWACIAGIITGKPGGLLDPRGTATRVEMAAMLYRLLETGTESN